MTYGRAYYALAFRYYIDLTSFACMALKVRKTADTFNSHHRQGISLSACLKTRIDFLSKPQAWHIIAAPRAVYIINKGRPWSAFVASHHASACIYLRLDDIQCFALMIYRRQAADDIHALRRDLGAKRLKYLQIYGIMGQRKAASPPSTWQRITIKIFLRFFRA